MKVWVAFVKSDLGPDFDQLLGVYSTREKAKAQCQAFQDDGEEDDDLQTIISWKDAPEWSLSVDIDDCFEIEEFTLDAR